MKKETPSKAILYQKYVVEDKTIRQIADELNTKFTVIRQGLKMYNITLRKGGSMDDLHLKAILTKEFLTKEYVIKKRLLRDIAKDLKCSVGPIRKHLKRHGIPIRHSAWNKDLTKETDERVAKYGRNCSKTLEDNPRTGEKNGFFGKSHNEETREILRQFKLGKPTVHKPDCNCPFCRDHHGEGNAFYGHEHTEETRKQMVENHADIGGENNPNWKGGLTDLYMLIRHIDESKIWRKSVFERDNYTCKACNKTKCYLEAHHKKAFAQILQEFLQTYSQFSPVEDKETLVRLATTYKDFWDVSNGMTLCRDCHDKTKRSKKSTIK